MDYVVGSVAALISGNVTPNRPKLMRRALTPTKHQPSPNVTPKSEFVEDRSIFLSPTQQKKKAIVKKSPKRIFENPDLDTTEDCEGNSSLPSPKADKVKKHLKDELDADNMSKNDLTGLKSPGNILDKSSNDVSPSKKAKIVDSSQNNETTPKKKKKKRDSESYVVENSNSDINNTREQVEIPNIKENEIISPKKKMLRRKSVTDISDKQDEKSNVANTSECTKAQNIDKSINNNKEQTIHTQETKIKQKKKKRKNKNKNLQTEESANIQNKENKLNQGETKHDKHDDVAKNKKNRKKKSKQKKQIPETAEINLPETDKIEVDETKSDSENEEVKSKNIPNPNAITEKDSDSEHDSDDEIESENEETNKKILKNEPEDQESSDEEDKEEKRKINDEKKSDDKGAEVMTEEEIKRTLFVGNVPFSSKCKKEIKKIFNKYGQIETIRIRTIPVKDARVTPKLAVIKNELHPERTTVNVYIKYTDSASVGRAIAANNTLLNGNHLRVSRSDTTGSEHDPHCAVFVGNLPFAIEDETLRSKFEKCGEIASVRIIRDKKTNAGKGFGYINFTSKDGVELALSLPEEDLTIKNRIIRVKRCTQGQSKGRPGAVARPPGKWNQGRGQGWEEGAARRLMYKRKQQEGPGGGDGPPNKRQKNITQPSKEKKPRKEFVGMTAEKKKKPKFNKGQKKKKALSEIFSKS